MKYKVGNRVKIKSLDWYNENKNKYNDVDCDGVTFVEQMKKHCGKVCTISKFFREGYNLKEDDSGFYWNDEMIEGLVEEETKPEPKFKIGEVVYVIDYDTDLKIQNRIYKNGMWNYIINIESAPFIFYDNELKKKKEYPKTYEECAKIMNCPIAGPSGWLFDFDANIKDTYYRKIDILMGKFTRLLICRDAYWKIAGEELGLDRPWEPDWNDVNRKYFISLTCDGISLYNDFRNPQFLAFPTEEMRDTFYENFKDLIEQCKELL